MIGKCRDCANWVHYTNRCASGCILAQADKEATCFVARPSGRSWDQEQLKTATETANAIWSRIAFCLERTMLRHGLTDTPEDTSQEPGSRELLEYWVDRVNRAAQRENSIEDLKANIVDVLLERSNKQ